MLIFRVSSTKTSNIDWFAGMCIILLFILDMRFDSSFTKDSSCFLALSGTGCYSSKEDSYGSCGGRDEAVARARGISFLPAATLVLKITMCSLFLCNLTELLFPLIHLCWWNLSLTPNKRVAEVEKAHASLTEELQRRYACPGCGVNNMVGMEEAPVVAN